MVLYPFDPGTNSPDWTKHRQCGSIPPDFFHSSMIGSGLLKFQICRPIRLIGQWICSGLLTPIQSYIRLFAV